MSEFKGTKLIKILHNNDIGYGLGVENIDKVVISVWGNDEEAKANALLISKALDLLEELDKARQIIRSLKLSMLGHPDCTYNSEFDDLTTKAQQSEDEIEKLIKEATEL
jgi:hypothetical protein